MPQRLRNGVILTLTTQSRTLKARGGVEMGKGERTAGGQLWDPCHSCAASAASGRAGTQRWRGHGCGAQSVLRERREPIS
eukprot:274502-Pleurochrysis_carterae.AAC.6